MVLTGLLLIGILAIEVHATNLPYVHQGARALKLPHVGELHIPTDIKVVLVLDVGDVDIESTVCKVDDVKLRIVCYNDLLLLELSSYDFPRNFALILTLFTLIEDRLRNGTLIHTIIPLHLQDLIAVLVQVEKRRAYTVVHVPPIGVFALHRPRKHSVLVIGYPDTFVEDIPLSSGERLVFHREVFGIAKNDRGFARCDSLYGLEVSNGREVSTGIFNIIRLFRVDF